MTSTLRSFLIEWLRQKKIIESLSKLSALRANLYRFWFALILKNLDDTKLPTDIVVIVPSRNLASWSGPSYVSSQTSS